MKKSNEEKRVVIYCRESRDDYGENYERIETQRDLLIKYCKSHGYTNIAQISRIIGINKRMAYRMINKDRKGVSPK